jgi:hypothetical protein
MSERKMHDLFADWYRQVDLDPSPELLKRRWNCVNSILDGLSMKVTTTLVGAFLGLPGTKGQEQLIHALKEADSTFPMKENAELVRVLAGACLAQCIDEKHDCAPFAALGLVSASCHGVGPKPLLTEVLEAANSYVMVEGQRIRHDPMWREKTAYRFRKPTRTLRGRVPIGGFGDSFQDDLRKEQRPQRFVGRRWPGRGCW